MINKNILEYKEKIENLQKYILSKDYGVTLTFEELNEFIGEDLEDEFGKKRFKNYIRKVRHQLYRKGYVLRGIINVGYYILKPNQIAGYTYRNFMLKPLNSFYTAQIILENTERKKLDTKEKQTHIKTSELNIALMSASQQLLEDDEYKILRQD